MDKNRKRAIRFHHSTRLKKARWNYHDNPSPTYLHTPKPCSNPWRCGNPRRNPWAPKAERQTMQERRAFQCD